MPNGDDYTPDFMTPGQIAANRAYAQALMSGHAPTGPAALMSNGIPYVGRYAPALQGAESAYGRVLMNQAGAEEQRRQNEPVASMLREPIPGEQYATGSSGPGSTGALNPPGSPQAMAFNNAGGGQVKGSWFGNFKGKNNWVDDSDSGLQASGVPTSVPGIALPNRATLGQLFDVTTPDGRTFTVRQTDLGPAKWTGKGVDINAALAEQMGYTPKGPNEFPTGGQFTVKPHQGAAAEQTQAQMGQSQLGSNQSLLQFAGPGAEGTPDAANDPQAAMAMALARGGGGMQPAGPGAPPLGTSRQVPAQETGAQADPSGFFPLRQQVSRGTMGRMMTGDVNPGLRQYMGESYFGQYQPTQMQGPYGYTYVRDARGNIMAIAPAPHYDSMHAGEGVSLPVGMVPTPSGGMTYMDGGGRPASPAPQGSGSNVPPSRPEGGFGIGGGEGDINPGLTGAPAQPGATPGPESEAEPTGAQPTQVAALETGTATDAPAPGVLGTPPPSAAAALANKPPPLQVAQAGGGPMVMLKQLGDYAQERKLSTQQAEEDQKIYNPAYEKTAAAGIKARTMEPQIEALQKINEDPRLITGPLSNIKQNINDLIAGVSGDKAATDARTLHDAFEKITQSNILGVMQEQLSGLGQVRNMEMVMLQRANASLGNTVAANRAILEMGIRSAKMLKDMGDIATAYRSGTRWDADGNVVTTDATDRATLAGQNQAMNIYLDHHKLIPDDKVAAYNTALTDPVDQRPVKKGMHQTYQNDTGPFQGYTATKPAGQ